MSDSSQGDGWWLASDGRWYPPSSAPAPSPPIQPAFAQYGSPMMQAPRSNGFAIASMVLGIVWIYWIGSILALIFGYKAKAEIDRSSGSQTGRGMAVAGIVLGWIGVAIAALFFVLVVALGNEAADSFDDINTDPVDGFCNQDRFLQDPDC